MIYYKYVSYIGISYIQLFVKSIFVNGHFYHHSSPSKFIVSILITSSGKSYNSKWTNARLPVYHAFLIAATNALLFSRFDFLLFVVYTGTTKLAGPFSSFISYFYCKCAKGFYSFNGTRFFILKLGF